jgi:hypothetical protein
VRPAGSAGEHRIQLNNLIHASFGNGRVGNKVPQLPRVHLKEKHVFTSKKEPHERQHLSPREKHQAGTRFPCRKTDRGARRVTPATSAPVSGRPDHQGEFAFSESHPNLILRTMSGGELQRMSSNSVENKPIMKKVELKCQVEKCYT